MVNDLLEVPWLTELLVGGTILLGIILGVLSC